MHCAESSYRNLNCQVVSVNPFQVLRNKRCNYYYKFLKASTRTTTAAFTAIGQRPLFLFPLCFSPSYIRPSPEDVVDADDTVGSRRSTVVDNGGVALHPHPSSVLGQEAVVLGGHLAFVEHWNTKTSRVNIPVLTGNCT